MVDFQKHLAGVQIVIHLLFIEKKTTAQTITSHLNSARDFIVAYKTLFVWYYLKRFVVAFGKKLPTFRIWLCFIHQKLNWTEQQTVVLRIYKRKIPLIPE